MESLFGQMQLDRGSPGLPNVLGFFVKTKNDAIGRGRLEFGRRGELDTTCDECLRRFSGELCAVKKAEANIDSAGIPEFSVKPH